MEPELFAIMVSEFQNHGCQVLEIGGSDDHVHVLHTLPRAKSVAQVMAAVKAVSSRWMFPRAKQYEWFEWQDGYGTFSADYRHLNKVRRYVRNQRTQHATPGKLDTFKKEYTAMLTEYDYPDFTPEYVFPTP
ncbi:transposase [Lewinella sp. 4G2]|uniref:transposase n=1 Tax=Lewinella sp. 4G2 TaxID=1803372 RepID=UPI0021013804|nr:transposase [Lewinella sp. 4G2]